jgi:hypothetical protein
MAWYLVKHRDKFTFYFEIKLFGPKYVSPPVIFIPPPPKLHRLRTTVYTLPSDLCQPGYFSSIAVGYGLHDREFESW